MTLPSFKLEKYFARNKSAVAYLSPYSDCEPLSLKEQLSMADGEILQLWTNLKFSYTESMRNPLLRQEISRLYQSISTDQVLVLTPEDGISITMNSLLGEGDHLIATFSRYQSLYETATELFKIKMKSD